MWNRSLRIATTKWASILIFVATAALATSTSAPAVIGASSCTKLIPTGGPYDILRTSSSEELHELLDEYFAKKDYKTHDEAINDGFSIGFRVYGVPLQSGGTFTKAEKDAWFSEYKQRRKLKLDTAKQSAFEQLVINVPAVKEISKCIIATEGFGLRASFEATSDCTATFSAWYRPVRDGERPLKVAGSGLMVRGGTCDPWPKNVVSVGLHLCSVRGIGETHSLSQSTRRMVLAEKRRLRRFLRSDLSQNCMMCGEIRFRSQLLQLSSDTMEILPNGMVLVVI